MSLYQQKMAARRMGLNTANFGSEVWFERYLDQHRVEGYRRNRLVLNRYFADFIFRSLKLIIEVDGSSHRHTRDYDKKRDAELNKAGFTVIRIKHGDDERALRVVKQLQDRLNEQTIARFTKKAAKMAKIKSPTYRRLKPITEKQKRYLKQLAPDLFCDCMSSKQASDKIDELLEARKSGDSL